MKYHPLLNLKKLRRDFVLEFISIFSPHKNYIELWELVNSQAFNDFERLSAYVDRDSINFEHRKSEQARYEEGLIKYGTYKKWGILGVSEVEYYLIDKVDAMVDKFDFYNTVNFLNALPRGVKRLKSNPYGERNHENQYEYTNKDGNEKLSHKGNFPKAHFRWNFGERYILDQESIDKIIKFLKQIQLYENI